MFGQHILLYLIFETVKKQIRNVYLAVTNNEYLNRIQLYVVLLIYAYVKNHLLDSVI